MRSDASAARCVALLGVLAAAPLAAQSAATRVIETERAFARAASAMPVRQAFLQFIADSGVLLGAGDRRALAQGPEWGQRFEWGPAAVGTSRDGDLAYSTGPTARRPVGGSTITGYGTYSTIWQRQGDGSYRFVVDVGVDVPRHDSTFLAAVLAERHDVAIGPLAPPVRDTIGALRGLEDAEVAARRTARVQGAGALPLARDVRVLRAGRAPVIGEPDARTALRDWGGPLTITVLQRGVARSHDLAWRAGRYVLGAGAAEERGHHLRVWRLDDDGSWRVVLEVWSPDRR
jgi:ketosteroid isomerase-like protein